MAPKPRGRSSGPPDGQAGGGTGKPPAGEKLQKVLARAGLGSRREMERWIEQGRISVNGKVAGLGDRVDSRDRLAVDGRPLAPQAPQDVRCILYHKPPGEVCSRDDPEGRRTVFERLPRLKSGRWISIRVAGSGREGELQARVAGVLTQPVPRHQ